MKKLLFILVLFSCDEHHGEQLVGCRVAYDKVTGEKVFLKCQTYQEFNPSSIRSHQWDTTDSLYHSYRWERCVNCE